MKKISVEVLGDVNYFAMNFFVKGQKFEGATIQIAKILLSTFLITQLHYLYEYLQNTQNDNAHDKPKTDDNEDKTNAREFLFGENWHENGETAESYFHRVQHRLPS